MLVVQYLMTSLKLEETQDSKGPPRMTVWKRLNYRRESSVVGTGWV